MSPDATAARSQDNREHDMTTETILANATLVLPRARPCAAACALLKAGIADIAEGNGSRRVRSTAAAIS
jgi:hypothetical protein